MTNVHSRSLLPLLGIAVLFCCAVEAQELPRAVNPPGSQVTGNAVYSPGVDAGDYIYISGQGPRMPDGSSPSTFIEQVKQALDNVHAIVRSAGLTNEAPYRVGGTLAGSSEPGPVRWAWADSRKAASRRLWSPARVASTT